MKNKINFKYIVRRAKEYPVNHSFLESFRKELAYFIRSNPPVNDHQVVTASSKYMADIWIFQSHFKTTSIILSVVLITFLAIGTVSASGQSLPGNFLYYVKIASENIQMAVTLDAKEKANLNIALAGKRLAEPNQILENDSSKNNPNTVEQTLVKLSNHLDNAFDSANELKNREQSMKAVETERYLKSAVNLYKNALENESSDPVITRDKALIILEKAGNRAIRNVENLLSIESETATASVIDRAERKLKEAENKIERAQKNLEKHIKTIDGKGKDISEAEDRIQEVKKELNETKKNITNTEYQDIINQSYKSQDLSSYVDALLETSPIVNEISRTRSELRSRSGRSRSLKDESRKIDNSSDELRQLPRSSEKTEQNQRDTHEKEDKAE